MPISLFQLKARTLHFYLVISVIHVASSSKTYFLRLMLQIGTTICNNMIECEGI